MIRYSKSADLNISDEYFKHINEFSLFCSLFLNISIPYKIILISKSYKNIPSTGSYSPSTNEIFCLCENRSLVDILRTIVHELVHHKQNINNELPQNPQDVGGHIENEANIFAGALIKLYIRVFNCKHIYKL